MNHKTYHRSKTVTVFFLCVLVLFGLAGRLVYLMVFQSEYYTMKPGSCTRGREASRRPEDVS